MFACADSRSEWNKNVARFYKEMPLPADQPPPFEAQLKDKPKPKPEAAKPTSMPEGGLYNRNLARFFGEKSESKPSSRGSVFQQNAARFYGYETPQHGERPYVPPPKEPAPAPGVAPAAKPVLAQKTVSHSPFTSAAPQPAEGPALRKQRRQVLWSR
jgi:hypothetical protein